LASGKTPMVQIDEIGNESNSLSASDDQQLNLPKSINPKDKRSWEQKVLFKNHTLALESQVSLKKKKKEGDESMFEQDMDSQESKGSQLSLIKE
jgi:hypothetical protein